MKPEKLVPSVQHYSWGDGKTLPALFGLAPDGRGWAELWLGTHPKGPSALAGLQQVSLKEYIGRHMAEVWGAHSGTLPVPQTGELPFLLKVLAVGAPLSIQCHPAKAQAEAGFRREESLGIPPDSPHRSYRDDNHKPEIICALTHFKALCGFRFPDAVDRFFRMLAWPRYENQLRGRFLIGTEGSPDGYRRLFSAILTLTGDEKARFIDSLIEAARRYRGSYREFALVEKLLELYPQDPAVSAPLFLNLIELEPGEALFQPAGELHAYIEGAGVELMASSDNVLRGGLTPKTVDLEQLLEVVRFAPVHKTPVLPQREPDGSQIYRVPVDDFLLLRITGEQAYRAEGGESPCLLLCTAGTALLSYEDGDRGAGSMSLDTGEAVFVPAAAGKFTLTADAHGELFAARLPRKADR
jgi:mannose-6-phosphate isomerase